MRAGRSVYRRSVFPRLAGMVNRPPPRNNELRLCPGGEDGLCEWSARVLAPTTAPGLMGDEPSGPRHGPPPSIRTMGRSFSSRHRPSPGQPFRSPLESRQGALEASYPTRGHTPRGERLPNPLRTGRNPISRAGCPLGSRSRTVLCKRADHSIQSATISAKE